MEAILASFLWVARLDLTNKTPIIHPFAPPPPKKREKKSPALLVDMTCHEKAKE